MNLTQQQKDDYLIEIKKLNNKDLLDELLLCYGVIVYEDLDMNRIHYERWCYNTVYNETKIKIRRLVG
ncbi:MAG: hypothetical protein HC874_32325 [Richelia sp. SL_2_1]|nr:hypothetical protein [Richelia sp. SL_2_1]